jgi:renalase
MKKHTQTDVLIVGAGMAGLMAAQSLAHQHIETVLLEKNDCVGGRLATAEMGGGQADHGAQFFTVRNPQFRVWVNLWLEEGLAFEWSRGWSDGSLTIIPFDSHPRYAIRGGMTALAEHLAADRDVRLNTRLVSLAPDGQSWLAVDENGHTYAAPALLLTPPVPLSLQMLDAGEVALSARDREALESLEYDPCLTGLFRYEGTVRLPEPGAIQRPNAPIAWIADNRRKGLSPDTTLITVQASAAHSRRLWNLPDRDVLVALEAGLHEFKAPDAALIESRLERWLYAVPIRPYPNRCLRSTDLPGLVFAGDAFGSPRVEGAALSGLAAVKALVTEWPG